MASLKINKKSSEINGISVAMMMSDLCQKKTFCVLVWAPMVIDHTQRLQMPLHLRIAIYLGEYHCVSIIPDDMNLLDIDTVCPVRTVTLQWAASICYPLFVHPLPTVPKLLKLNIWSFNNGIYDGSQCRLATLPPANSIGMVNLDIPFIHPYPPTIIDQSSISFKCDTALSRIFKQTKFNTFDLFKSLSVPFFNPDSTHYTILFGLSLDKLIITSIFRSLYPILANTYVDLDFQPISDIVPGRTKLVLSSKSTLQFNSSFHSVSQFHFPSRHSESINMTSHLDISLFIDTCCRMSTTILGS